MVAVFVIGFVVVLSFTLALETLMTMVALVGDFFYAAAAFATHVLTEVVTAC